MSSDEASAAAMLRTVLAELPPTTGGETATVRRIEGAALALDALTPAPAGAPREIEIRGAA